MIAPAARRSKFNAAATVIDGERFDSAGEARRWSELQLLVRAGHVRNLRRQVSYPLTTGRVDMAGRVSGGDVIGHYVADFVYTRGQAEPLVVEDYKGYRTPLYVWKRKHFEAQYGIRITETTDTSRRGKRRARRAGAARVSDRAR
jgi:hypothetical protein